MLVALIANNQNVTPGKLPTIQVDRGGAGPLWPGGYDIVDIGEASALFPEVAGEHPVARAVRRTRWIGEALPRIREARERQRAAAFLVGAHVGQMALDADVRAQIAAAEARAEAAEAELAASSGSGIGTLLVAGGILLGVALLLRARAR